MADAPEVTPEAKPKDRKVFLMIMVLVSLVVGDLTFRAVSYFRGDRAAAANSSQPEKEKSDSTEKKEKKTEPKTTLTLDPFLVNLADKEDIRFVKVTFHLGLGAVDEEASKNPVSLAAMRDAIISILSSKTSEQILSTEGKTKLREEILSKIHEVAPHSKVQEVFIVDFVVQL